MKAPQAYVAAYAFEGGIYHVGCARGTDVETQGTPLGGSSEELATQRYCERCGFGVMGTGLAQGETEENEGG